MRLIIASFVCVLCCQCVWAQEGWTPLPEMDGGRFFHSATILRSGDVLIVGGFPTHGAQVLGSDSGLWADVPDELIGQRSLHTATLMDDGRVLVAGGRPLSYKPPGLTTRRFDPHNLQGLDSGMQVECDNL